MSRETFPKEEYPFRYCPSVDCIVFRQAGARRHDERPWVDPARVADPRAAIEAMVGPLAKFEIVPPKGDVSPKLPPRRRRLGKGRARRAAVMRSRKPLGAWRAGVTRERRLLNIQSARLALRRQHK